MHLDPNTITTPAPQPSSKLTRKEHPLITYHVSGIFHIVNHISHPISIEIVTFPLPYRYTLNESEVQVTRQAAPELHTDLQSFSTIQITFSNSGQCIISRNSTSNAVSLHSRSCHPKPHVSHVVFTNAHDTANLQASPTPLHDIFMRKYHMRATYVNRKVAVSVQFSHPMKSTVQYVTQYLPAVALT